MRPIFSDYDILFIIAASVPTGPFRRLIREMLASLGWLFAVWMAYMFSSVAAGWVSETLPGGLVTRTILGFVLLFIVTVIVTSLVGALLSAALASAGLKPADRGLGMVLRLVRGSVVILVLVTVAGSISLSEQLFRRDVITWSYTKQAAQAVRLLLPSDAAKYVHY